MTTPIISPPAPKVPAKLNGYNIIADGPYFRQNGTIEPNVRVIMGHDPSRRYPKYVTALVNIETTPREWFWGHYFEGAPDCLTRATKDWISRMNAKGVTIHLLDDCAHEPYGETKHCASMTCPNYIEKHR